MNAKLTKLMQNMKTQNPKANWSNLLTGLGVLVMVALFSYAYFNRAGNKNLNDIDIQADSKLQELLEKAKLTDEPTSDEQTTDEAISTPSSENAEGTTVVARGEGLWNVAQRVCGDAEKYNVLANANGLNIWEDLNEGMTLKIVCE